MSKSIIAYYKDRAGTFCVGELMRMTDSELVAASRCDLERKTFPNRQVDLFKAHRSPYLVPIPTLCTVWNSLPSVLMLGAMIISVS